MKPWSEVVAPHPDIRAGTVEESVFAAALAAVVADRCPAASRCPVHREQPPGLDPGAARVRVRAPQALLPAARAIAALGTFLALGEAAQLDTGALLTVQKVQRLWLLAQAVTTLPRPCTPAPPRASR